MTPKIPPPVQGLFWLIIMWALYKFIPALNFEFTGQTILAAFLLMCGVILDLVSVLGFFKAKTTINPLHPDKASQLVVTGFYKFTRNPMYLGMALILTAWGVHLGSPLGIIGLVGFVGVMNHIQIKPEEDALENQFGADYLKYKQDVRRWI